MSKAMTSHPEPERLLRYVDAEVDAAEREEILAHLGECEECRSWLDELESGEKDYRNVWMPAWRENAAPPPEPWFDLRANLREADRARRIHPRWFAVAAAVLIAVVATRWFPEQTVSADSLLRDAAAREESSRPRVTPLTRAQQLKFETARYRWQDPLSARTFAAWRNTLDQKQDRVVKLGEESYEISTHTELGALEEARLRLRISDLHVIQGVFQFRNREVVEIVEIQGGAKETPGVPDPIVASPAQDTRVVEAPITAAEELRVWAALHRIGADLGEPIEIDRDASRIAVTALGLNAARRQALEDAVRELPGVQVQFRDPQAVREPSRRVPGSAPPQLGNADEEFVDRILQASESGVVRAHALNKLAQRFPLETERQFSPADKALLKSLVADHLAALEDTARRVVADGRRLQPAVIAVPQLSAQTWQAHAPSLVTAVEQVDQILTRLLATGDSAANRSALLTDLDRALAGVEGELRRN
jgi:hypothetical protein